MPLKYLDRRVNHRWLTDIPNCTPAYDVMRVDADGQIVILNPAPKAMRPWDEKYDDDACRAGRKGLVPRKIVGNITY